MNFNSNNVCEKLARTQKDIAMHIIIVYYCICLGEIVGIQYYLSAHLLVKLVA